MSLFDTAAVRVTARLVTIVLTAVAALALGSVPSSAASAEDSSPKTLIVGPADPPAIVENLLRQHRNFEDLVVEDSSVAGRAAIDRVPAEIAAGRITVHLPAGSSLAGVEAKVFRTEAGQRFVFVPYVGSVVRPSGLTVTFDRNGTVTQSFEAVYQARSQTSGTVAVWVDGRLTKHVTADASGATTPAKGAAPGASSAAQAQRNFFDELWYCLTVMMGVPNWLLSLLATVCAVACATAVLCGPCLFGLGAGYGSEISYCIGWAAARSG